MSKKYLILFFFCINNLLAQETATVEESIEWLNQKLSTYGTFVTMDTWIKTSISQKIEQKESCSIQLVADYFVNSNPTSADIYELKFSNLNYERILIGEDSRGIQIILECYADKNNIKYTKHNKLKGDIVKDDLTLEKIPEFQKLADTKKIYILLSRDSLKENIPERMIKALKNIIKKCGGKGEKF